MVVDLVQDDVTWLVAINPQSTSKMVPSSSAGGQGSQRKKGVACLGGQRGKFNPRRWQWLPKRSWSQVN
jgi:hypothetical protein